MATSCERDVRVLLVDDAPYFRSVMGDVVAATPGFAQIGDASCGEEALEATFKLAPELVVMDIRMPGAGGLATARLMAERHPQIVILLVSAGLDPEHVAPDLAEMSVSFASKAELSTSLLREVWNEKRAKRKAVSAPNSH